MNLKEPGSTISTHVQQFQRNDYDPAPLLRRFTAAIVDALFLVALLASGVALQVAVFRSSPVAFRTGALPPILVAFSIGWCVFISLVTLTEVVWATSLGKKLLKLYILDAAGNRARYSMLIARWLMKYLWLTTFWIVAFVAIPHSSLILLFALAISLLGSLTVMDGRRRTLHDLVAGTAVFQRILPRQGFDVIA